PLAEREGEGLTAVARAVELGAVVEGPRVVDRDGVARLGLGAGPGPQVGDLRLEVGHQRAFPRSRAARCGCHRSPGSPRRPGRPCYFPTGGATTCCGASHVSSLKPDLRPEEPCWAS